MSAQQMLLGGAGLGTVGSADFDGTSDYLLRGSALTGIADTKEGIFSGWFRIDGGDGNERSILEMPDGGSRDFFIDIGFGGANRFRIVAQASDHTVGLTIRSTTAYAAGATWLHLLSSWKLDTALARHLYINDASDLTVDVFLDKTINYTGTNVGVGARVAGTNFWDGCMAEIFFHTTYLDITVEANRRLFINAAGKPVFLGYDGAIPLGVVPMIYQHLGNGETPDNFATNRGTGGGFTVTGALTAGSTSPNS